MSFSTVEYVICYPYRKQLLMIQISDTAVGRESAVPTATSGTLYAAGEAIRFRSPTTPA